MNDKTADRTARGAILAKTTYEATVIGRALDRAGHNPYLKGHIHEILVKDSRNLKALVRLSGESTQLTQSATAKTVDLVTTGGGRVLERLQLKDAPASIGKIVRQVESGQYRSAQLLGTKETTSAYNAAAKAQGLSKTMTSSGVSSRTTESLAQRAGAAGSGTLTGAMTQAAKAGGAWGAIIGAGVEAVQGVGDLYNGERTLGEVALSTAKAGAKGGVSGAAASAATRGRSGTMRPSNACATP